jgi:hypothetical protein
VKVYNWARILGDGPLVVAINRELAKVAEAIKTPGHEIAAYRTVTAATTLLPTDGTILCDATAGAFAVTLPDPETVLGRKFTVARLDGANNVTITGTIHDGSPLTLSLDNQTYTVHAVRYAGTATWKVV